MWPALVTALRFLTIIPVPRRWAPQSDATSTQAQSLYFYPLVGLVIGMLLVAVYWITLAFSHALQALILVTVWVVLTGALHLDGLADSADAWLGGHGDRERTLKILRDTHVGVAAVIAIVLTLLLKIALLAELQQHTLVALLIAPVIGRSMVLLLFMTTRYVRAEGLGKALSDGINRKWLALLLLIIFALSVAVVQWSALIMWLCVLAGFLLLRYQMVQRLGGTTGDTAGALVEISEILALLGLVLAEKIL